MLRLHLSPPPPPPQPAVCRRLAVSPPPRPTRCSASATSLLRAARGGTPRRRLVSVGRAVLGEQRGGRGRASDGEESLDPDEAALARTRQLVECAMFAAVAGLAYFLSNSLAIEKLLQLLFSVADSHLFLKMGTKGWQENDGGYCFTVIHIVWPCKSINLSAYAWSSWSRHGYYLEIRAVGACGYVLLSSFLIRENILALITVNIHASLTYILAAAGVNTIPSMDAIYVVFGTLLLLNCGFFVFLLHIMYTVLLAKLGIKPSLRPPRWLEKAI
ncbi:hypothetical protein ACP4OV_031735 [Aristida adscensionis]